jgi:hypothetical protein
MHAGEREYDSARAVGHRDMRACATTNRTSHTKEVSSMKLTKNLGMLLLGIWLILTGLIELLSFSFAGLPIIMAILAIAAGVLILLGR